jgi:glutamate carboxypeptidase
VSPRLLRWLEAQQDRLLSDLEQLVVLETPSGEKQLLDVCADVLAERAARIDGASVEVLSGPAGNHVRIEWPGRAQGRPVLLLGHYDTVWPAGTLERMPFRRVGDRVYGPGVLDMKAGLVQGLWAVRTYRERGGDRPIVLLATSDEETGSESSRPVIEAEARRCAFALVLEPALDDGSLKTSRRGLSRYRIRVTGRSSHAGLAPDAGVSAVEELCELVVGLASLADDVRETDVNVGLIEGGSRFNVVAASASCDVGFRTRTAAEAARIEDALARLRPKRQGASLEIRGGVLWPPMERTRATEALARHAIEQALELGFELGEGHAGGASDGCHCAAAGAPVLDGLGAVGGGAHADDEYVLASALPLRTALLVRLLQTRDVAVPQEAPPADTASPTGCRSGSRRGLQW